MERAATTVADKADENVEQELCRTLKKDCIESFYCARESNIART
jgi:hypothetical protein